MKNMNSKLLNRRERQMFFNIRFFPVFDPLLFTRQNSINWILFILPNERINLEVCQANS